MSSIWMIQARWTIARSLHPLCCCSLHLLLGGPLLRRIRPNRVSPSLQSTLMNAVVDICPRSSSFPTPSMALRSSCKTLRATCSGKYPSAAWRRARTLSNGCTSFMRAGTLNRSNPSLARRLPLIASRRTLSFTWSPLGRRTLSRRRARSWRSTFRTSSQPCILVTTLENRAVRSPSQTCAKELVRSPSLTIRSTMHGSVPHLACKSSSSETTCGTDLLSRPRS
mmetsp:Transcript_44823/g.117578  ORF Transcript_44823/g.117578 Transcript_44823/m.117578 type:complete len:224 (-) Transcript_44823:635-1306(-)